MEPEALVARSGLERTLSALLSHPVVSLAEVRAHLAALDGEARIRQCRALGKAAQVRLFEVAAEGEPLAAEDMVAGAPDGETVRWYGRNTLPLFTLFEKRFARQDDRVVGFNFNSPFIAWLGGPGYYVCRVDEQRPRELLIDYTKVPATAPDGWPRVRPNDAGFARLIYGNMYDYCRRVSDTVVIGAATRLGRKALGQYFVLCRG